ncbi:GNAT family N-acetyltransferase [Actinomadura rupiterrae]|uniref:GNAT family N-acetyltransferase n=1 Tax=Actinomadura rupiterrae TaxID=559627 RepID=UPI0020A2F6F7|nr:GNAT family N-acetyltransferase [Actinomadura rupiterrae]MCP2337772.1 putative acetyltransferase [Actinomadura rupiterrae]
MPELILPDTRIRVSFLAAMEEFRAEGRGTPDDDTSLGRELRAYTGQWDEPEAFERYVRYTRSLALEETPRPPTHVPATFFWWVEGDEYLGRLSIRHRLTPWLLDVGGHIGYDVRPTARRRGHATAMLRAALPHARALGIDPALITCDADNTASRLVIERNGGLLEDRRGAKLRYWVPCPQAS